MPDVQNYMMRSYAIIVNVRLCLMTCVESIYSWLATVTPLHLAERLS